MFSTEVAVHCFVYSPSFFLLYSSQDLSEEELSEEGVELRWPGRSVGLTAQLQTLRKALYHKYVQEVAALKEQHDRELKRLREERQPGWKPDERQKETGEQDLDGVNDTGCSDESLGAAEQVSLEKRQDKERVEEEVAKVGDYVF